VAYLSLDMNIAAPERAALEHFWPKLVRGGVIVLDDYGWAAYSEQKASMDEFAAAHGIQVCCLPTGQGLIVKP
jgi:predicted O-methyltransferase YrrM